MSTDQTDPLGDLRKLIGRLPDEAIHAAVEVFVRGLVLGVAEEIITHAVDAILDQCAKAAEAPKPSTISELDLVEAEATRPPRGGQDDHEPYVCELCGRRGVRRFVRTPTGWKCAPTARCGNRPAQTKHKTPAPPPVIAAPPAPVVEAETKTKLPQGITAKCTDCTRSWNLTGRMLRSAIDLHEHKTGHIVIVEDGLL